MEGKKPHIPEDVYNSYSNGEKLAVLYGALIYDEETEEYTKPISKEQAEALTDIEIDCVLLYMTVSDLDFELDLIAYDSFHNIITTVSEREKAQEHEE